MSESFRVADSCSSEGFGSGRSDGFGPRISEGFEVVASVCVGLVVADSASVTAFSLKFNDFGFSGAVDEAASVDKKN